LMITLAVATIVLTIGIPSFQELILNNRMVTQTNDLLGALALTRSEAIKRGVQVVMCRSAGSGCAADLSRVWETGWIIFADPNENGLLDAGEPLIRVREGTGGAITIRSGGNFARWVGYQPSGVSRGDTNLANDTFRICDSRGRDHARFVAVNSVGRATIRPRRASESCP